jgi:hypothetical protein
VDARRSIVTGARAIESLAPALAGLEQADAERAVTTAVAARGWFTPEEEECLRAWFARYLTIRGALLETLDEMAPLATTASACDERDRRQAFVVAITAAALLVRMARFLVHELAADRVVQRKLNEAAPHHRIPRKQYTAIYRSLTSPRHAWRLAEALLELDDHRVEIEDLIGDPVLGPVVHALHGSEESLRVGVRAYLRERLRFRHHSWRRRRSSAAKRGLFQVFAAFGRVVADVRNPLHRSRVRPDDRRSVGALLRPGDVFVTRHDDALSNLFLPGYWPHVALHVGDEHARRVLGVDVDSAREARWVGPIRVLEARKDGVRLRTLDDTLAVDAFTVLRPRLHDADLARAISAALTHEGKLYNFDFDFFTDDRLVCTEVVYRAFEGVGGIAFPLTRRAGRVTLSAEDIIRLALRGVGFEPVAIFGTPEIGDRLVTGDDAVRALEKSMMREETGGP